MPGVRARNWRLAALAYVALLIISNAVRILSPVDGVPAADQNELTVPAIKAGQTIDKQVRFAYRDLGNAADPVLLLLHGTPVAGSTFSGIAPELSKNFRLVIPDLPGFGGSTHRIPDYSVAAHAAYVDALLAALDISSVHAVGYSQSGGVALELYRRAPERVESLTLLSAIGVQELELLGDFHLNHALYLAQLAFFNAVAWGVPHFGFLDDAWLNRSYARNFFDSDQRPLRGILRSVDVPTLIIHGSADGLVPMAAASEHHRIVPQSELVELDGGHMMLFKPGGGVPGAIESFVRKTESGRAASRSDATAGRIARAEAPFDWREAPRATGIALAVIFLLLVIATYVSEDLTCIAAGLLVARGTIGFIPATSACLVGIFTGDLLLYLAGKHLGRPALKKAPLKWIVNADSVEQSEAWFEKRGPIVIILSRFMPGTRLATYTAAGVLGTSLARFIGYFLLAAVLWTPMLVGAAWLIGGRAFEVFAAYSNFGLWIGVGVAIGLLALFKIVVPLFSFRGRRLLLSSWRRKTRWEFWPPWLFYPPLFVYLVYLGIRYRGFTTFTAANPAIEAGGFIGESKDDILEGLSGAGDWLVKSKLLPGHSVSERMSAAAAFMQKEGLDYPVVLKPNAGERGRDVAIIRSEAALHDYLDTHCASTLIQQYAPGHEFGIFYYRLPDAESGEILAITDKRPPSVTGDGSSTLEELILGDDRAVCMASHFLGVHSGRLYDTPANGEDIQLVEVGTHCLGCKFVDGEWIRTPELERVIDQISKTFDGFYFGRYDIKTPSVKDLKAGQNFKIVELNGVTSEATNIYDPGNSIFSAYRLLMRQWHLAYRIGAANRERGARTETISSLWRLLQNTRRQRENDAMQAAV